MTTPEARFHAWFFPGLLGVLVLVFKVALPWLEAYPEWVSITALLGSVLASSFIYRWLAQAALSAARKWPPLLRILLRESYVGGYWIGKIETPKNGFVIAIEHYDQDPSKLEVYGESYWPDGTRSAVWSTVSAIIDPAKPWIHAIYRTQVFDGAGNTKRNVEGFGNLRIEGDSIYGWVIDQPAPVKTPDGEKWEAKTFYYYLERLKGIWSFAGAKQSLEYKRLQAELGGVSRSQDLRNVPGVDLGGHGNPVPPLRQGQGEA